MKKKLLIVAVLALVVTLCMGLLQETTCSRWTNIRTVSSDDSATVPTVWASKPSHIKSLRRIESSDSTLYSLIQVRFSFSGGNGKSCDYFIYVRARGDDSRFVVSGTVTAGTQVATAGGTYGETITRTQRWDKTVSAADAEGDNGMAVLSFDGMGSEYIEIYIDSISSGSVLIDIKGLS